jgi:hypothetical protein
MGALTSTILRGIRKRGPMDLIEYYRRPIVGRPFRERINIGLRLLPQRARRNLPAPPPFRRTPLPLLAGGKGNVNPALMTEGKGLC